MRKMMPMVAAVMGNGKLKSDVQTVREMETES